MRPRQGVAASRPSAHYGHTHGDSNRAGGLHHDELSTTELEQSVVFREWLVGELGNTSKDEWETGRSWQKGPTYLVVKQATNSAPVFAAAATLTSLRSP